MEFGVQVFGALKRFRENTDLFFERLAEMGYTLIEPCLLLGDMPGLPERLRSIVWKVDELPGFLKKMHSLGLKVPSCHIFTADAQKDAAVMLGLKESFGMDVFVCGAGRGVQARVIERAAELNRLADTLAAGGVSLWLHNGKDECLAKADDGVCVYETLLRLCPGVGSQIDTGWALAGNEDPIAMGKRLGAQLKSVHIKDMALDFQHKEGLDQFAVLGEGVSDIPALLALAGENRSVILDQDFEIRDFYDDFKRSIDAMQKA